jgi:predicted regulator of Ras-like GTPase activity (Roadblock/LC7/MglB family)
MPASDTGGVTMLLKKAVNGQQLTLSEEVYRGITKAITELSSKVKSDVVIFCESNGYPVTYQGDIDDIDLSAISSLAANNFSATARMATMLGEDDSFKYLFHEGEHRNIYLSNVGFNFILLVIFGKDVALGMVRIFTKKTIDTLAELLSSVKEQEEHSSQFIDLEFKTLLSEELNKSLKL